MRYDLSHISDELRPDLERALKNLTSDLRHRSVETLMRAERAVISYTEAFDEVPCWLAVFPDGVCEGHDNPWDTEDSLASTGTPACVEVRTS